MPWFARIGRRLGVTRPSPALIRAAACLYVFDLLGFGDRDLRTLTYLQRRERLERLGLPHGPVLLSPYYRDIPVSRMLAVAAEYDNEGVIAKRVDSTLPCRALAGVAQTAAAPLHRGGGGRWLAGHTSSEVFGSLLVAAHDEQGRLALRGAVGTGFSGARRSLQRELHGQGHCSPLRNCATARVW